MSSLALHFAGGGAFFSGAACLLIGIALVICKTGRIAALAGRLAVAIGIVVVACSATPLPSWAYGIWILCLVFWMVGRSFTPGRVWMLRLKTIGPILPFAWTLAAIGMEIPYQISPAIPKSEWKTLFVIGDSLSAADPTYGEKPWPEVLADRHPEVHVVNLAQVGATVKSAMKQSAQVDAGLVILEIGGNDLLGHTSPEEFADRLELLFGRLAGPSRTLVMLELPLPPFYNRYGAIQRRLAHQHGVFLIPKRYFAGVLGGEAAVLDGLHLSPNGHRKMAEMIWRMIGKV